MGDAGRDTSTLTAALKGRGHDSALVGSKAAALDRLIRAGFTVPRTFVVTSDAYRSFIAGADLDRLVADLVTRPIPSPALAEAQQREVLDAFVTSPMPGSVAEAIRNAFIKVKSEQVAVRSSATAEDLHGASFAGQYSTHLGVEGVEAVIEAVRRVWASLWFPWASAYRRQMGIAEDDLSMAVIIQAMVRADRSGVAFTTDPGGSGAVRVEVVSGLGEQLVSGRVTPDVHLLRRPGLGPLGGGRPDPLLRAAAHVALRIEEEFGGVGQDVEWSIERDQVWVLQARPITATEVKEEELDDGFDTPVARHDRYVMAGVTEMLPGVLSPLLWTINGPMVEEAFRRMYAGLRSLPAGMTGPFGFIGRSRGRARLNLSAVQRAAASLAGWSPSDVERLYVGDRSITESEERPRRLASLIAAPLAMRLRRRARRDAEAFTAAVHRVTDDAVDVHDLLLAELVAYRARVRDLAAVGVRAEVTVAAMAVAAYHGLEALLEKWGLSDAATWTQRITRNAGSGVPTAASCCEALLADLDPELRRELAELSTHSHPEAAAAMSERASDFMAEVRVQLARLGSAAIYAGPGWDERPDQAWQLMRSALRAPETPRPGQEADLHELEEMLAGTTRWKVTRVLTGQIIDMRRRILRRMVEDATELLRLREHAKAAVLMVGGLERAAIDEIAARLVARGLLDRASDVELLSDWELDDLAVSGIGPPHGVMVERRRVLERWRTERIATSVTAHDPNGEALEGWGASPGRARGTARVVVDPALTPDFQAGSIIVAEATDPSWLPLLLQAGGLIVERGGPLSHAAIVAREFGLPAVLNLGGATALIPDGAEVEVDGTLGVVTLVGRDAAGSPERVS